MSEMKLRGKKPDLIQKRLKLLMYGAASTGKTTAALSFPSPYLIDTERGAEHSQYKELLDKQNGAIFQSDDFDEIVSEVRTLLCTSHDYKTLIIDPITPVWTNILENAETSVGSSFNKHYGVANKNIKYLISMLYKLDMNVILTAHSKDVYAKSGEISGATYDGYKKLDYIFDLALEIRKEKQSKDRIAKVVKTRISTFTEDEEFIFKYDTLASKYGKDIMEKKYEAMETITVEQIKALGILLMDNQISDEKISCMLEKSGASKIEELDSVYAQKCIDRLSILKNKKCTIVDEDVYM
jgi:RecA/RadA recombinase